MAGLAAYARPWADPQPPSQSPDLSRLEGRIWAYCEGRFTNAKKGIDAREASDGRQNAGGSLVNALNVSRGSTLRVRLRTEQKRTSSERHAVNASQEHDDIPLVRSMSPRAWAQRKAMLPEQRKPRVGVATGKRYHSCNTGF